MKTKIVSLGALVLATTCGGAATADDDTPKLHPIKEVCVSYESSGQMMNGTTIRCHRDYGYEIYEIESMSVGFGGFSQTQQTHRVTIGDQIYAINPNTNTGTQTTNPMYQQIADAVAQNGSGNISDAFLSAMGYTSTGQVQTIAGLSCAVFSSQMTGTTCLTDDGLALQQSVMGNVMTATSIAYEPGEDENYRRHEIAVITEGPDLSNGIGGIDLGNGISLEDMMNPQ